LAASHVCPGDWHDGRLSVVSESLRKNLRGAAMLIYITAAVALFLFIYLWVAMIRPEWF
jgi:K+-transporting ATPase KdpF subunit